jgi:hypothetical protein
MFGASTFTTLAFEIHLRPLVVGMALAAVAIVGALAVWFTRPGIDAIDRRVSDILSNKDDGGDTPTAPSGESAVAELTCTIQPDRSRIVSEPPTDMDFAWNPNGCVNGRTQYGFADGKWTRLFVPNSEAAVSVNSFDPETRIFRTDRFALSQSTMVKARTARAEYRAPACGSEDAANRLGEMQTGVTALLPAQANERLVYRCRAKEG